MRKTALFLLFSILLFSCASAKGKNTSLNAKNAVKETSIAPAPHVFKDVSRSMKSAGYWISKIQNPDKVILTNKEISALNARTIGASIYLSDIQYFPAKYYKKNVASDFSGMIDYFSKFYDGSSDQRVGKAYFKDINKNIDYALFESTVNVRFAMTVGYAELRAIPSKDPLYSSLNTLDIDRMQLTQLDLASPLAVLYFTKDREWCYVVSEIAEGWIERRSIAFCRQNAIKDYKRWDKNAVTISPHSDIFMNKEMTDFFDSVKMGTVLPIAGIYGDVAEIRIPAAKSDNTLVFQKAYIRTSDISIGFLKYTQRNVLQQAFKHMDSPYGWGGMNGAQDCSDFIRQIFACFGIVLPRNSSGQAQSGVYAASFEKGEPDNSRAQKIIKNGIPGMSILYFPGHIMLYVGSENGKPYIIHSIWGYDDDVSVQDKKTTYLINRVVITAMNIGETSAKGPLLQRVTLMKNMK